MGQSKIEIPFNEIFEIYSGINLSKTPTDSSKKIFLELAKSMRLTINSYSSNKCKSVDPEDHNGDIENFEEILSLDLSREESNYSFGSDVNLQKIKKCITEIKRETINFSHLNFLGNYLQDETFHCVAISFDSRKFPLHEKFQTECMILHFSVREQQIKYFLQDLYSASNGILNCVTDEIKFFNKHFKDFECTENIEEYYRIV